MRDRKKENFFVDLSLEFWPTNASLPRAYLPPLAVRGEDQWYCTKDMLRHTVDNNMTLSLKDQGFVPIV